jgi:hypothetical protein
MSTFKKLLQVGLRLMPVALLPWYTQLRSNCFFWNSGPSLARNKLENRSHIQVEISNSPCEDRNDTLQLTSIDGYAAAVYDGHGGWQVVLSSPCSRSCAKRSCCSDLTRRWAGTRVGSPLTTSWSLSRSRRPSWRWRRSFWPLRCSATDTVVVLVCRVRKGRQSRILCASLCGLQQPALLWKCR